MDEIYLEKILAGDSEAYRYFIRKYKDLAYSIAMSVLQNENDAQEIIQIAFVRAYDNLATFKGNSKFGTWFYRIVINESLKYSNKHKSEILDFKETLPDVSTESINPLLKLEADDQTHYINEALKQLLPKECLVLRLFYLEQNTIEEVREMTGWSVPDIKVTLHRARIRLKQVLKQVYNLDNKVL